VNHLRLIAVLVLLPAGGMRADDMAATNQMPDSFHALMETAGYGVGQTLLDQPLPGTNDLKYLPPIDKSRLMTLRPPPGSKSGWSFWNNTNVKYVGRNNDPINFLAPTTLAPYTTLSKYEYDITYSFDF